MRKSVHLCVFYRFWQMSTEILKIGGFRKQDKDARQNSTDKTLLSSSPSLIWSCFGTKTMIEQLSINRKTDKIWSSRFPVRFLCDSSFSNWSGTFSYPCVDCCYCSSYDANRKSQFCRSLCKDCLSLNVWSPSQLCTSASNGVPCTEGVMPKKLPVFFWIHGGAFIGGSGQDSGSFGL